MKQLYYSYIYPHLIYTLPIWGTHISNKTYMQPLHRTHKKIIRLICNRPPQTHTKPLMKQLKILNIFNLYIYRTAIDMHPHIHLPEEPIRRPEHNYHYIKVTDIHQPDSHKSSPSTSRTKTNTPKHTYHNIPSKIRQKNSHTSGTSYPITSAPSQTSLNSKKHLPTTYKQYKITNPKNKKL